MHTPASIAKHPIHPMLVTVPIGLWVFSFVCDLAPLVFGATSANWHIVAYYTMVGGVFGALAAAIPGFIDMLSLPRAIKRIAIVHMVINLTVVVLYCVNAWLRAGGMDPARTPFWLSLAGIVMLGVSGWLGGRMVYLHGAAVTEPHLPAQPVKESLRT